LAEREELDALIKEKSRYFVSCYECPVRVVCTLGDEALSARVSLMIRLPVKDENLSDAIDALEAMWKIGQNCHLLNGCYHVPEEEG